MKKIFFVWIVLLISGGAMAGLTEKKTLVEQEFHENGKLKAERTFEGGMLVNKKEYDPEGRGTLEYTFEKGALVLVIQHNWGYMNGDPELPLAWDHVFTDAPVEIEYDTIGGDKSQSASRLVMNIRKTSYKASWNSKEGNVSLEYEANTPDELWIKFAGLFDKKEFASLESGKSKTAHDGQDETFLVKTVSGTVRVMNYRGAMLKEFFDLVREEESKARAAAVKTVKPRK